jgi:hypothetical protein
LTTIFACRRSPSPPPAPPYMLHSLFVSLLLSFSSSPMTSRMTARALPTPILVLLLLACSTATADARTGHTHADAHSHVFDSLSASQDESDIFISHPRSMWAQFSKRQIPNLQVPAQCESTCDPVNAIIGEDDQCTVGQCCNANFAQGYFDCFKCVGGELQIKSWNLPQKFLDGLVVQCSRKNIQLPLLSFPGQNPNRVLSTNAPAPPATKSVPPATATAPGTLSAPPDPVRTSSSTVDDVPSTPSTGAAKNPASIEADVSSTAKEAAPTQVTFTERPTAIGVGESPTSGIISSSNAAVGHGPNSLWMLTLSTQFVLLATASVSLWW